MRQFLRQVHAIHLVKKSLLCTVLGREAKTQEFMRELLEESPLIIGQEVSVLVLTHANFTHLGISSKRHIRPDISTISL